MRSDRKRLNIFPQPLLEQRHAHSPGVALFDDIAVQFEAVAADRIGRRLACEYLLDRRSFRRRAELL